MTLEGPRRASNPEAEPVIERIASAAVRFKGGIWTGAIHPEILARIQDANPDWEYVGFEDGFLTSAGRFVDRKDAVAIADAAEQLRAGQRITQDGLYTESLKPEVIYPERAESYIPSTK